MTIFQQNETIPASAPRLQTYCDAATSSRERETRLPRQDVIHDASTSGAAGTSGMGCSAGLCRDTKPRSPPRRGRRYGCRNSTSLVERSEVPEHQGPQGEKESGWRLWWYASSFMPPRSPAGASHSIHHEVNNRSLCDLIHHDARELAMRRPSVSTLLWRFAARSPRTNP